MGKLEFLDTVRPTPHGPLRHAMNCGVKSLRDSIDSHKNTV